MGVFQLPKSPCEDLEAMCAKFWWGQVGNERKIHWKSWSSLTISKKKGGMGFRDLRLFNLAMLAKIFSDKWLPNHPTNKVLSPLYAEDEERTVSELIDPKIREWRREFIMANFHNEDAYAICRSPLSHRSVTDSMIWLHNKKGVYSVKSGYHVARQIMRDGDVAESSSGPRGQHVWAKLWNLHVPTKIKDVWAGSQVRLQKHTRDQGDTLQLFESLLERLPVTEFELFLVQAWLIWNQRNTIVYGGKLKDPNWLNKRAVEFLQEFQQAQDKLDIPATQPSVTVWQPPPTSVFKLNFDAAVFAELKCSGFGAIIRNGKGKVMAAMLIKGPPVADSEEAEVLACRKALEFAIDVRFTDLIIEGDNVNVMRSISSQVPWLSLLEGIYGDVLCLIHGLH
ncbi:uncharacterized protein LOC115951750 [Quercus lobata]|uniref:uncharacterized protein LOC115951750 n=1 Tax=Quercus lobata TaxID=97700 RepID=UPI0012463478|nr:uncharacterized protein LOC115951750 [Quercus lobata]